MPRGNLNDLVAFLAKGLLIPSCALVTATMTADFVDVARVALYPLGVAVGEHDGSAQGAQSARCDDGGGPGAHLALPRSDQVQIEAT